jgi:hypothetical protein
MQLPKETKARIKEQAVDFWGKQSADGTAKERYEGYKLGREDEAELAQSLLSTLESIKEDCKSKGTPMDLVLQSIYNRADKAVRGYNQTEIKKV